MFLSGLYVTFRYPDYSRHGGFIRGYYLGERLNENWNFEEKLSHYRQPELWVKKFSRYIDMDTEGQVLIF